MLTGVSQRDSESLSSGLEITDRQYQSAESRLASPIIIFPPPHLPTQIKGNLVSVSPHSIHVSDSVENYEDCDRFSILSRVLDLLSV